VTRAALEAYQDALAAALVELDDPRAIKARLLADAACAPFAAYVATFDLRALEVSARLAKRWRKTQDDAW
jgi:hypothetical protein